MPTAPKAEEIHADEVRDRLANHNELAHLRVRRRANLLVLESGTQDDPIPHVRLRRITARLWLLEAATHYGRWENTGVRGQLKQLLEQLISAMPWLLASLE